jgi:Co/Zn/Cd efflux system component
MKPRSARLGALASAALIVLYLAIIAGASGSWEHVTDQARQDWYYLVPIVAGFGTQVALVSELRRRHRLHHGAAAGMVACCAHHIADLAPFIGATAAATFLTDYRIAFMIVGIGVNAIGIAIAAHRLQRTAATPAHAHKEPETSPTPLRSAQA